MKKYYIQKDFEKIKDELSNIFNLLEHNDKECLSSNVERAIDILDKVSKDLFCQCNMPQIKIPLSSNKCLKCEKHLILEN